MGDIIVFKSRRTCVDAAQSCCGGVTMVEQGLGRASPIGMERGRE